MNSTTATRSKSNGRPTEKSRSNPATRSTAAPLAPVVPAPEHFGAEQAFHIVASRPGDHHAVHRLLVSLLHQPTAAEFQAQLEDPFYEPTDRLLVKRGEQIVAHARLTNREMLFGDSLIPISTLGDLVVLPEYRGEGCGTELLRAAERTMVENGAKIAFLQTQTPEFFVSRGWTICTRHSYSIAGARDILSRLHERRVCPHDRSLRTSSRSISACGGMLKRQP